MFVGCLAVQYAGYARILVPGLRVADMEARQAALKRWVVFAVVWQGVVIVVVVVYALAMRGGHPSLAWVAPPLAALAGTAIPYQLAANRLLRMLRD